MIVVRVMLSRFETLEDAVTALGWVASQLAEGRTSIYEVEAGDDSPAIVVTVDELAD